MGRARMVRGQSSPGGVDAGEMVGDPRLGRERPRLGLAGERGKARHRTRVSTVGPSQIVRGGVVVEEEEEEEEEEGREGMSRLGAKSSKRKREKKKEREKGNGG